MLEKPRLKVSYHEGCRIAAYLYLPRKPGEKSVRSRQVALGYVVDFAADGRAIGIEMLDPDHVTLESINRILQQVGAEPITESDLAPLKVA
ncbi:MAG: DUF2283 domain-containing protein [Candidatus Eisenbacteria bacterium]|nr:DUF2283 domain-containing protein [Candidatus Eisenbacteria bacterium]